MTDQIIAVDLGATSGRVISGFLRDGQLQHHTVHRFANGPVTQSDGLHWNATGLFREIVHGLTVAGSQGDVCSIGVDSWAVDYGLLSEGVLLNEPFHYRDARTERGVEHIHRMRPFNELFTRNGLQFLPFNSIYQLSTERWSAEAGEADLMLLIPDLINFWLTGSVAAEITNASTTGLIGPDSSDWDGLLIAMTGAPRAIFPELATPGVELAGLSPEMTGRVGYRAPVIQVASHDTASAVVAVPMESPDAAYISCGTWGLVGVELTRPIVTDEAREANFTNERGADNTIRFLHNVMGLWLLNESMSHWATEGPVETLGELLGRAADYRGPRPVFDVNDSLFMAPGDIPVRVREWLTERGLPNPEGRVGMVATIVDSLASAFADAVSTAGRLSGTKVQTIHLVGGGSQSALLCQRVADYAGVPVVAGPVEATAMGNLLVQARSLGLVAGDLWSLRAIVRETMTPTVYLPR